MRERAARARHLIRVGNARKERAIAHPHTLAPSEIRLINVWNRFFSANGDIRVFGANIFLPVQPASVSYRRGPRRCKDSVVLDGELKLQVLALVIGVGERGVRLKTWLSIRCKASFAASYRSADNVLPHAKLGYEAYQKSPP